MALFVLAAITDFLDGYIARTYKLESNLGILLDPIADKVLVLPLLFFFAYQSNLNIYLILILVFKDVYTTLIRLKKVNESKSYEKANIDGKLKTIVLFCLLIVSMINLMIPSPLVLVPNILLVIALILALFAPITKFFKPRHQ
jgi:CDP-diacylglycerol--glycerol-3-phosphate 3-phosphatidyltransferase